MKQNDPIIYSILSECAKYGQCKSRPGCVSEVKNLSASPADLGG